MDAEARAREIRFLADNPVLKELFADIERDAYEEMLRIPSWMMILRPAKARALVERIKVIRDVRSRMTSLGNIRRSVPRGIA